MGFAKNGSQIDLDKKVKDSRLINEYKEEVIKRFKLKKKGSYVRFVYPKNLIKKNKDNPGKPDKPRSFTFPLREIWQDNEGNTDEWRYFESANIVGASHGTPVIEFKPESMTFNGNEIYTIKDVEKIVWLLYFCSRCIDSKNSHEQKIQYLTVDDPMKRAIEEREEVERKLHVDGIIYGRNEDYPEEKVREIASMFYIPDAMSKDKPMDIIQMELRNILKKEKNGYKKFEEYAEPSGSHEADVRLLLQKLIDERKVGLQTKGGNKIWRYITESGKMGKTIYIIPPTADDSKTAFYKFLKRNRAVYKKLQEIIH